MKTTKAPWRVKIIKTHVDPKFQTKPKNNQPDLIL